MAWRRSHADAPATLDEELELAALLFDAGLYFDTHEFLETAWKRESGAKKTALQGLIQIAAGLHKLELDPKAREGSNYLSERGMQKVIATRTSLPSAPVTKILAGLASVRPNCGRP